MWYWCYNMLLNDLQSIEQSIHTAIGHDWTHNFVSEILKFDCTVYDLYVDGIVMHLFGTGSHEHFKQFNAKTEMQWQMSEIHWIFVLNWHAWI